VHGCPRRIVRRIAGRTCSLACLRFWPWSGCPLLGSQLDLGRQAYDFRVTANWGSDRVAFHCGHCGTHSVSECMASAYFVETIEDDEGATFGGPEYRYRLVKCTACGDVTLLLAMKLGWNHDQEVYEEDSSVYPAQPRSLSSVVPKTLQDCFQEARSCYQARAYTASAIMCRRALELLAIERGITERTLARSLDALKGQGDIDQRLYDWCDALRLAGNKAAHDVGPSVSQVDAKDMSDLAEAIIDYVYVFQARYEQFKERRSLPASDTS
jgi:Domain of unknown function (DUF4145)